MDQLGAAAGALQCMCEHLERWTLCGPPPPRACRSAHSPIKRWHDRWQRERRPGCHGAGFLPPLPPSPPFKRSSALATHYRACALEMPDSRA